MYLAAEDAGFDEEAALARVLRDNPKLAFEPGRKFSYSNIGYWLLGKVVERVSGRSFREQVQDRILSPLGLSTREMGFAIPDPAARGIGSVVMVNRTVFNSTRFLNRADRAFLTAE